MSENTTTPAVQSIRETVVSALENKGVDVTSEYSSYRGYADSVIEALEERETEAKYALREEILEQVEDKFGGSYAADAEGVLENVGLEARPEPEPEAVTPDAGFTDEDDSDSARITRLEQGQAKIVEALEGLTALANRHLGASL